MAYDRDASVDAGFRKAAFLPILQSYEQDRIAPPLIGNTVGIVQKIDEAAQRAFQRGHTDEQLSKEISSYAQSCKDMTGGVICRSAVVAASLYYHDLFKNDSQTEKLGEAKAYLLYADEWRDGKSSAELKELARKNVTEAKAYCDKGDKFFCGVRTTLENILIDKVWSGGFLGQVFAPYFGTELWCEEGPFESAGCIYKEQVERAKPKELMIGNRRF